MAKVLLVEDDNNLREIFEMRLQAEGYTTVTASDGEEGIAVALREKPDLIVADIMMPKLSGFEMLESLQSAPEMKNTKVIMMTALGQAEDQARGQSLGVVKYLVKSQATLEDFAKVVREVLPPSPGGEKGQSEISNETSKSKQEREQTMQEDQTTNNPTPGADSDAPADTGMGAPANPVMGNDGAPAPAPGDQMSSADEQSGVNDQINNFVNSAPTDAPAAPATDAGSDSFTPATPPAGDMGSTPAADSGSAMGGDSTVTPEETPPAVPPAETPSASPPSSDSAA